MKNKPFEKMDGREAKTISLRENAFNILGGEEGYESAPVMMQSLACMAARLWWMIENEDLTNSEFTQASNAHLGVCKKIESFMIPETKTPAIKLSNKDMMTAVSDGVRAAVWDIATNATDMPCADFYEAIKGGVSLAANMVTKYDQ